MLLACLALVPLVVSPQEETIARIAFGSCFKLGEPTHVWDAILATEPDLFLMIGDNIYADTEDMDLMRAGYDALFAIEGFTTLRENVPFLATWDDHDYGENDAGREYPKRAESQQLFLDFCEVSVDDPRRAREGVYHAVTLGPKGRRVQVILLDTRYFRDALDLRAERPHDAEGRSGPYRGTSDPTRTVLGEAQWAWLAERLREPAELRLVVSSIQVVAEDHAWERWMTFPHERRRLLETVRDAGATAVVFLSGDRHVAELSRLDVERAAPGSAVEVGYPLFDLTSSSLNLPFGWRNELNRHRVGSRFHPANFGLIEVSWDEPEPRVRLEIRDDAGQIVLRHEVALSALHSTR